MHAFNLILIFLKYPYELTANANLLKLTILYA